MPELTTGRREQRSPVVQTCPIIRIVSKSLCCETYTSRSAHVCSRMCVEVRRLTLWERTTRTGSPFWQDTSSALLELSNFWSNDWTCVANRVAIKQFAGSKTKS